MLGGSGHQPVAAIAQLMVHATNRQFVRLAATTCEDNLGRPRTKKLCNQPSRPVEMTAGLPRLRINAGRVSPSVGEHGEHDLEDSWVKRSCRGVVEVDSACHSYSLVRRR